MPRRAGKSISKAEQERPLFRDSYLEISCRACQEYGSTQEELAALLGVSQPTICVWMREIPEFADAVQSGLDKHRAHKVERSLYRRAIGWQYDEIKTDEKKINSLRKAKNGQVKMVCVGSETHTVITKREVLPDIAAIIFFLQNRAGQRWKNLKYESHETNITSVVNQTQNVRLEDLSAQELEQLELIATKAITRRAQNQGAADSKKSQLLPSAVLAPSRSN